MKILIIEDEIHLAHNIIKELANMGYAYEIITEYKQVVDLKTDSYDMILLSTTTFGQKFLNIIKKFKNLNIILLNSYSNYDLTIKAVENGANDYILKPFIMSELIRKIKNLEKHSKTRNKLDLLCHNIKEIHQNNIKQKIDYNKLPFCIEGNIELFYLQLLQDSLQHEKRYTIINDLEKKEILLQLSKLQKNEIAIISSAKDLNQNTFDHVVEVIQTKNYKVILTINTQILTVKGLKTISITDHSIDNKIISIDDFIKNTILNFQYKYSDTKISSLLGISRKNLWEKRGKYGIKK